LFDDVDRLFAAADAVDGGAGAFRAARRSGDG